MTPEERYYLCYLEDEREATTQILKELKNSPENAETIRIFKNAKMQFYKKIKDLKEKYEKK